jgi:hypothetical protein
MSADVDLDTWRLYCDECGNRRAVYLGRRGVFRVFMCCECGAEMALQEREERAEGDERKDGEQ